MKHSMHLLDNPFQKIKSGQKIYEIRLHDEKRKRVKIGDIIIFENNNEYLSVEVLEILKFKNISELQESIPKKDLRLQSNENLKSIITNIYSQEKIDTYGIIAIKIKNQS